MKVTKYIPNGISRRVGRQALRLQKASPNLLFGAGIVGVIGGTVLACKATLKLPETLDDIQYDVNAAKSDTLSSVGHNRQMTQAYVRGSASLVKLYAPAIVVSSASIAALTKSHVTLTRRNASLTVAYAGLQKAYEDYRDRVREELGEEKELDLYHGIQTEKVKIDGKVEKQKHIDPNKLSPYARVFDNMSQEWKPDHETNLLYLRCQQNWFNDNLQARGHVFLNEVYDALDIPRTQAGQSVGWVLNDEGDNYIDFGLYTAGSSRFVNGVDNALLLDFNVDGVILGKI